MIGILNKWSELIPENQVLPLFAQISPSHAFGRISWCSKVERSSWKATGLCEEGVMRTGSTTEAFSSTRESKAWPQSLASFNERWEKRSDDAPTSFAVFLSRYVHPCSNCSETVRRWSHSPNHGPSQGASPESDSGPPGASVTEAPGSHPEEQPGPGSPARIRSSTVRVVTGVQARWAGPAAPSSEAQRLRTVQIQRIPTTW
eukprot:750094-Hanusia_phi.AAC.4